MLDDQVERLIERASSEEDGVVHDAQPARAGPAGGSAFTSLAWAMTVCEPTRRKMSRSIGAMFRQV